jgi:hypothetical protein
VQQLGNSVNSLRDGGERDENLKGVLISYNGAISCLHYDVLGQRINFVYFIINTFYCVHYILIVLSLQPINLPASLFENLDILPTSTSLDILPTSTSLQQ